MTTSLVDQQRQALYQEALRAYASRPKEPHESFLTSPEYQEYRERIRNFPQD